MRLIVNMIMMVLLVMLGSVVFAALLTVFNHEPQYLIEDRMVTVCDQMDSQHRQTCRLVKVNVNNVRMDHE